MPFFVGIVRNWYQYVVLLMLASQRIESVVGGWFWGESTEIHQVEAPTKRGATPSAVEWLILAWVSGKLLYVNVPCTISYFVFDRLDLERGETTVGHWITRVRQRYVECDRFRDEFVVRGNGGITCGVLFSCRHSHSVRLCVWVGGKDAK